jgi:hypothetical protein
MNMSDDYTYKMWLVEILNGSGGWLGYLVSFITMIFTIGGAILGGMVFFTNDDLPRIILATPGLIIGAISYGKKR